MIEHNVEDDFNTSSVKRFDHVAELVYRAEGIRSGAVRLVWREKGDRCIAPVINPARRAVLAIELEYRKKFNS